MTGSMRVGALSKGLLLVNENEVEIVIICSTPPTIPMLNSIVTILPEKLKVIRLLFSNTKWLDPWYLINSYTPKYDVFLGGCQRW